MFLGDDEIKLIENRFDKVTDKYKDKLIELVKEKGKVDNEEILKKMEDERAIANSAIGDLFFDVKEELGVKYILVEKEILKIRDQSYNSTSNTLMLHRHFLNSN